MVVVDFIENKRVFFVDYIDSEREWGLVQFCFCLLVLDFSPI